MLVAMSSCDATCASKISHGTCKHRIYTLEGHVAALEGQQGVQGSLLGAKKMLCPRRAMSGGNRLMFLQSFTSFHHPIGQLEEEHSQQGVRDPSCSLIVCSCVYWKVMQLLVICFYWSFCSRHVCEVNW